LHIHIDTTKISLEKRECKSRADNEVIQPNYNSTQANYYTRMDEISPEIKVC